MFQVLSSTKDPERRLAITNDLIRHLERADNAVVSPASQLMRVDSPAEPGAKTYERVRPSTPLSEARRYAETAHPKGEGRHHRRDLGP